ncbi:MAG: STAS domain-containing protein [Leptolyngbya sp. SIO4C5]|uniref:STAS domain-containing protein n=1 Tax=Sphaerothrix gracilis TaxID=3151835 RepID=UPI0013BFE762|nr:STAS domain-containing protein [Leptolyngbya sp. SIO4C5]
MSASVKILEPAGILDSNKAEEFRQQVDHALDEGNDILLINLKDISFVDSSGLGALVVAMKKAKAHERRMYVCSINEQVRMLFELTSMDRVFEVFSDRQEFEQKVLNAAATDTANED